MNGSWNCFVINQYILKKMKSFSSSIFLVIFFIILSLNTSSQVGTIKIEKPKTETTKPAKDTIQKNGTSFDLYFGYKIFTEKFQNKFNTYQQFNVNSPIQLIGFGESGPVWFNQNPRTFYAHMFFNMVVPQPVWINDTIKCKVTGFIYSLAWGGYFNSKSKNFYANFYLGFNTGRLRFYDNEIVRQKNPFFSPKVGIQPKLQIGKFCVNLLLEAEYDISKTSWRKMKSANNDKITIDKFKQTGATALLGISYKFIKSASTKEGP